MKAVVAIIVLLCICPVTACGDSNVPSNAVAEGLIIEGRALEATAGANNLAAAKERFAKAADLGSHVACYELARVLLIEDPVKHRDEAMELLTSASSAGVTAATRQVGIMLLTTDRKQGLEWLTKAADEKDAPAMIALGDDAIANATGDVFGEASPVDTAVGWYRKASSGGDLTATLRLVDLYKAGKHLPADASKVRGYTLRAATLGDGRSMLVVARAMMNGDAGWPDDQTAAFEWLNRAVQAGETEANIDLGDAFLAGRGVKEDPEAAFACYQVAADAGNIEAMQRVADCYERGQGVKKDLAKSKEWSERAMNATSKKSQ